MPDRREARETCENKSRGARAAPFHALEFRMQDKESGDGAERRYHDPINFLQEGLAVESNVNPGDETALDK